MTQTIEFSDDQGRAWTVDPALATAAHETGPEAVLLVPVNDNAPAVPGDAFWHDPLDVLPATHEIVIVETLRGRRRALCGHWGEWICAATGQPLDGIVLRWTHAPGQPAHLRKKEPRT